MVMWTDRSTSTITTFKRKIDFSLHPHPPKKKMKNISNTDLTADGGGVENSTDSTEKIFLSPTLPPMFKPLIPYLKLQLRLCNFFATIPFEWDEVKGRVRLLQSKMRLLACKGQMLIHITYTLIMTIYFLSPTNIQTTKNSTRMIGLSFLVCFGATMFMRLSFWQRKKEVVHLINNYIVFEDTYLKPCRSNLKGDKISRALMTLGLLTSAGLPSLMSTIILVSPCKAPHLGYILFREGEDGEGCAVPPWSLRIGILIFDTWMWINSITCGVFFAFQVFFPGLKCLAFYIQLVGSVFRGEVPPLFPRLSTQDRFCFKVYNHIRVLAKLYNFCLQSIFIPTQITAACMVIIIGLYTCIKLHSAVPMPGFAFFPLLTMDGIAMIFISQVAAGVYTRSKSFVNCARRSRNYRRKSWFTKMSRAQYFIKIRFGSTNYIDQMTPLVYMNFCLTQTVSLVILT